MSTPVLHLLAGSNGAGKTTFVEHFLLPAMALPFVNADLLAEDLWPGDRHAQMANAAHVSALAERERDKLLSKGASFIAETVFSHVSKLELVARAKQLGYYVELHAIMIPEDLAVARVADRVAAGRHDVPEDKVRSRYPRVWTHLARARTLSDRATFYDNSSLAQPYRVIAEYDHGQLIGAPTWPAWTPQVLLDR